MDKGEVFIPKLYSLKITDLAKALKSNIKFKVIGVRPGEKVDELLCSKEENKNVLEFKDFYVILSSSSNIHALPFNRKMKNKGRKVQEDFYYSSRRSKLKDEWL